MNSLRRHSTARRTAAVAGLAALVLGLSACSGDTTTETTASATSQSAQAETLVLEDGWAKAAEGMTGVFGTLKNTGTEPLTVTGGSSPAAGRIETHTMVDQNGAMVMVKDEDGFDVPAGGTYELKPGGDHIMLIDLKEPLASGTEVTLTLTTEEGTEATVTVPVREFTGADEKYLPGEGHGTEGSSHSMTSGSMTHGSATEGAAATDTASPDESAPATTMTTATSMPTMEATND